ncbi:MAG: DUF4232 domain-containing protein [Actinomycetota bacterium]
MTHTPDALDRLAPLSGAPSRGFEELLRLRAKRQRARKIGTIAFVTALIVTLLVAGLGTIEDRTEQPGGTGGPTSLAGGPCTASQLRASATMEGAAASREGQIVFTNVSEGSCTLQGTPTSLFNVNGGRINGINFVSSPTRWQAEGDPKPAGWPVVTLEPGDRASIRLRWSNWCAQGELSWDMSLASGGGIVPIDRIGQDPPPCNGPNEPSTIEIGPIEPGADRNGGR